MILGRYLNCLCALLLLLLLLLPPLLLQGC
jgi:hypothetical protein